MSTYTKKKCPICGYTLQGWTKDNEFWRDRIGEPFQRCPNCKRDIRRIGYDEYIKIENHKTFIFKYLLVDFIKSVIIGGVLGVFLLTAFDIFFDEELMLSIFVCSAPIISLFTIHCLVLKIIINRSLYRTKDLDYCKRLYDNRYITEKIFNELKSKIS